MNLLPPDKRCRIRELRAQGATIREIASAVGCAKETIAHHLGDASAKRRLKMARLVESVMDWIDEHLNVDGAWADCNPLCELHCMTRFSCPAHPEADPDDMLDSNGICPLCHSDGMRRHHARRRAAKAEP